MASFSIQRSLKGNNISREHLLDELQRQLNLSFTGFRVRLRLPDGLRFAATPKQHFELLASSLLRFKMHGDSIELLVNGTVGFSASAWIIILAGWSATVWAIYELAHHPFTSIYPLALVISSAFWVCAVVVYDACVVRQVTKSAFEQFLDSMNFDLS